VESPLL